MDSGGFPRAKPLLPDALWGRIEPLLPPPKPRRKCYPGRKPIDHRKALTDILFVLKSGIHGEDLPDEMGCGSGMTCWRRGYSVFRWPARGFTEAVRSDPPGLLAQLTMRPDVSGPRSAVPSLERLVQGWRRIGPPLRAVSPALALMKKGITPVARLRTGGRRWMHASRPVG